MKTTSDAIIIGAGVIGAATAFELCKRGYQTLNIDKLPAAGYGPTSSSCSIVRAHYSSWDGVAMAHEGFSYWQDWPNYLEIDSDGHEIAKYMQCGTVLLKSKTGHHEKVLEHFRSLGVAHEEWDTDTLKSRILITMSTSSGRRADRRGRTSGASRRWSSKGRSTPVAPAT